MVKALLHRVALVGFPPLVAVALVAGCTSGGHPTATGSTAGQPTGPRASASASPDPRAKALFHDYEAYWAAFLKASNRPDPASPDLTAHATGDELGRAQAVLTARRRAGESLRGSYRHREAVASIADSTAMLSDCLTPHTAVYATATGKLKSKDPELAQPLSVEMRLDNGVWKVALIKPRGNGFADCAR